MNKASYNKLRDGSWGVRVEGSAQVGDSVLAQRRDGTSQVVVISRVVWSGNGVTLASFSNVPSSSSQKAAKPAPKKVSRRNWRPCGYPGCNQTYCDECDGAGAGNDTSYAASIDADIF